MSGDYYLALLRVPLVCLQFVNVVFPEHTHSLFFIFVYQGKGKLGNYFMGVAKHCIYNNKFSDKQFKIRTFISMLKVNLIDILQTSIIKCLSKWTPFHNYFI